MAVMSFCVSGFRDQRGAQVGERFQTQGRDLFVLQPLAEVGHHPFVGIWMIDDVGERHAGEIGVRRIEMSLGNGQREIRRGRVVSREALDQMAQRDGIGVLGCLQVLVAHREKIVCNRDERVLGRRIKLEAHHRHQLLIDGGDLLSVRVLEIHVHVDPFERTAAN